MRPFALFVSLVLACSAAPRNTPAPPADAAAPAAPVRFVSLGDSFTIGTGSSPAEAWPAQLVARWGQRGCRVSLENPSVNGYATDDLVRDELPVVARLRPAVVSLAVGANDYVRGSTPERYRAQLRVIFQGLADAGVAPRQVFVLPQPDWSTAPAARGFGSPAEILNGINTFNSILEDETRRFGGHFAPLFALMQRQAAAAMFAPDGLHPNAAAHAAWAAQLVDALADPCRP